MSPRHRLVLLSALVVLAAACSSPSDQQSQAATPHDTASASAAAATPSSPAAPSDAGSAPATATDLGAVRLALEPVVELDAPTAMAVRPDDDALYVAERGGRVVRVTDGSVAADAVLDISSQTTGDGERGLLGIAFSPDGAGLYVSSTDRAGDSRLDEYQMGDTTAAADTRRPLLQVSQPYSNHNGGNVVIGPDGMLYYGLGDGGSAGDPEGNGQDRTTLLGGLLRIDPRASGDRPYRVPPDNPFVDDGDARGELWIYGLRNPWRFSFDRATDDLWIGDVGQGDVEEIDRLPFDDAAGANMGWNVLEGTRQFAGGTAPDAVAPIFEYPHDGRCSVTGGYVYRGSDIPPLQGAYVFSDYCDGVVRALVDDGGRVRDDRAFDVQVPALVSFGEDADGELYALSLEGTVYRLVAG